MSWLSSAVSTVTKPLRNVGVAIDNAVGGAEGWGRAVGYVAPIQALGVGALANATGNTAFGSAAIGASVNSAKIGASVGTAIGGSAALSKLNATVTKAGTPNAPTFGPAVTGAGQLLNEPTGLPPDTNRASGIPPIVWAALAVVAVVLVVKR